MLKNKMAILTIMGFLALTLGSQQLLADIGSDTVDDLAVTVYNGNYAIVRELRSVDVAPDGSIRVTGVPMTIDPTTVSFKCVGDPSVRLLEHNYQYDLVSTDSMLNKFIDKSISVIAKDTVYVGKLMSYDGGQIILKTNKGIVMIQRSNNVTDIRFDELPEGLLTRPTLMCLLAGADTGKNQIELSYQAGSVNWHSEYIMILNDDDTAADISGWVSLNNYSGRRYENALFKFIAGDVKRVLPPKQYHRAGMVYAMDAAKEAAPMSEKSFFEYHMYTMPRRTTLENKETKQLELFSPARDVKIAKKYVYNLRDYPSYAGSRSSSSGSSTQKVGVFVEFENSETAGLGKPLPAGKFRVFKSDPDDNSLQFIGENRIDHTPKNETVSLEIGKAFDLVGQWKQTNVERKGNKSYEVRRSEAYGITRESYEVKLRNRKDDEAVVIRVKAPLDRGHDWKIIKQNLKHKYVKQDAHNIYWDIPVAAGEEVVLEYTVEYEHE